MILLSLEKKIWAGVAMAKTEKRFHLPHGHGHGLDTRPAAIAEHAFNPFARSLALAPMAGNCDWSLWCTFFQVSIAALAGTWHPSIHPSTPINLPINQPNNTLYTSIDNLKSDIYIYITYVYIYPPMNTSSNPSVAACIVNSLELSEIATHHYSISPNLLVERVLLILLTRLPMVNIPKTRKTYCKGRQCKKHTLHKVTQYKTGKASLFAQGKRRYDRKQSGYGGQTKPVFHKKAKTTKKVSLANIY